MRRSFTALALAAALTAVGACSTLGEPVTLNLAELTSRCEDRGGVLTPTGAETGRAQSDYICREAMVMASGSRNTARQALNNAIDRSLGRAQ